MIGILNQINLEALFVQPSLIGWMYGWSEGQLAGQKVSWLVGHHKS